MVVAHHRGEAAMVGNNNRWPQPCEINNKLCVLCRNLSVLTSA
jgi:hypothetical protein